MIDTGAFKKRDDAECCPQATKLDLVVFGNGGSGGLVKDMDDLKKVFQQGMGMMKLAGIAWTVLGGAGVIALIKYLLTRSP